MFYACLKDMLSWSSLFCGKLQILSSEVIIKKKLFTYRLDEAAFKAIWCSFVVDMIFHITANAIWYNR